MSSTENPPVSAPEDAYVLGVRREISDLDRSLVELVNKRLKLVDKLWRYKDAHGIGHIDPAREEWMLQYLKRANRGPLSEAGLAQFFHQVLDLMKQEVQAQDDHPSSAA
jgi:chorismate mutase